MKKLLLIMLLVGFAAVTAKAQTWDEWFRQKKTQTRYLIEQIAALQVYIGHVKKTYAIAKEGLDFIGKTTNGEFNLHDAFFQSLKGINPAIGKYARVADIISLQVGVLNVSARTIKQAKADGKLQPAELEYLQRVFGKLLDNCMGVLDELTSITTAGKMEMKDDERIRRIDELHAQMQDNYTFAKSFGNGAVQLGKAREQEQTEIANSKVINGIN